MTTTKSFLKAIIIVLLIVALSLLIVKIPNIFKEYNANNNEENSNINLNQESARAEQNNEENKLRIIDSTDHVVGDINAPVQIIVYEDFNCKFCADLADTLKLVKEEFDDKVVIAYRHGVLTQKPFSYRAALAAECAAEQGKFWEMYDKLFYDFRTGALNLEQFKEDASDLGLSESKFAGCLEEEKYKNKIENQIEESQEASAYGSPTIFINQEILPGAYPFNDFENEEGESQEGLKSIINRHLESVNEN